MYSIAHTTWHTPWRGMGDIVRFFFPLTPLVTRYANQEGSVWHSAHFFPRFIYFFRKTWLFIYFIFISQISDDQYHTVNSHHSPAPYHQCSGPIGFFPLLIHFWSWIYRWTLNQFLFVCLHLLNINFHILTCLVIIYAF